MSEFRGKVCSSGGVNRPLLKVANTGCGPLASRFNNILSKFVFRCRVLLALTVEDLYPVQHDSWFSSFEAPGLSTSKNQEGGHSSGTHRTKLAQVDAVLRSHQTSGILSVG